LTVPNHHAQKRLAHTLPGLAGQLALEGAQLSNAPLFEWLEPFIGVPAEPAMALRFVYHWATWVSKPF
jgi:hypothetical protein